MAFVAALERAVSSTRYAALMPVTDASLLAVSRAREVLTPHTVLGLAPHGVVEKSLEKLALEAAAARHGLDSPAMSTCSGIEEAASVARKLGFPVVVKPTSSIVERDGVRRQVGSVRVNDETGLALAVGRLGNRCLIQRAEDGAMLSFAGVFAEGRLLGQALSRYHRTWRPEAGSACFSETIEIPPELRGRVCGLLEDLGWEGLFELELIERQDKRWTAVDFNPRAYGSMALAIGAGANLPAVWCAQLLGQHPQPVRARPGVFYRWEDADLRNALWQLRHGHLRAAAGVLRVRRGVVHPFFDPGDPGPLVARSLQLAKSIRRPSGSRAPRSAPQAAQALHRPRRRSSTPADRSLPVVVIGAGPYGLAAAAHLRAAGLPVRCFGEPLEFWRHNMPDGMILRSLRRATHIASPNRALTIDRYEREAGKSLRSPSLLLDEFIEYASWFQRRAVPDLDVRRVARVARADGRFLVGLEDGAQLEASGVVVAAGLGPFGRRPAPFEFLPHSVVSHSSDHSDLAVFAGKRVVVVGGGQSALESAALLSERDAEVEVLARAPGIKWLRDDTEPPTGRARARSLLPPTGVGGMLTGWVAAAPDAFRRTPCQVGPWISRRCIAPAGSGWLRPRVGQVTISCGRFAVRAEPRNGGVWLLLNDHSERVVDHVVLGTGYEIDVAAYPFVDPELATQIDSVGGYPRLGPGLESSVAGLYFLGAPAAFSFGPLMWFVIGTWYAAPALALRLLGHRQPPIRFSF
jgi:predicted ATP-grasp superfamily ATP-dependent carboligase